MLRASLFRKPSNSGHRRHPYRRRLGLEALERRKLLAVIAFGDISAIAGTTNAEVDVSISGGENISAITMPTLIGTGPGSMETIEIIGVDLVGSIWEGLEASSSFTPSSPGGSVIDIALTTGGANAVANGKLLTLLLNIPAERVAENVSIRAGDAGTAQLAAQDSNDQALDLSVVEGTITVTGVTMPATVAIAAADAEKPEGNTGPTEFTFTVTRDQGIDLSTSVTATVSSLEADEDDFDGGVFPSEVITFEPNETTKTLTILVEGDTDFESDESFLVTLSNPSGDAMIATGTASGTIQNDDVQPVPSLDITATNADRSEGDEGQSDFTFTVTRSGRLDVPVTVQYAVTSLVADPADFGLTVFPSDDVTFAANETTQTILIPVVGDREFENDETFSVTLSDATAMAIITTAAADGTIRNDDDAPVPSLSIAAADAEKDEGDSGTNNFTFTVTRAAVTSGTTSVDFAITAGGTNAADGDDFIGGILPSGTVNFADGETEQLISIGVIGDTDFEPDEAFSITLANPSGGATIGTASADATILNDDTPPSAVLAISGTGTSTQGEGDTGTTGFAFSVTRTGNTDTVVNATYQVSATGISPANGTDFAGGVFPTGNVSFSIGQTAATIVIPVAGDTVFESDETFLVTLSEASSGATITSATATGTIQNDDPEPLPTLNLLASSDSTIEGNAGTTTLTYTVTRTGRLDLATSVGYSVNGVGDNPASGSDFAGSVLPVGQLTFAPGQDMQSFSIDISGDTVFEPAETFEVRLMVDDSMAQIGVGVAQGEIQNDDPIPPTSFSIRSINTDLDEGTGGARNFTFEISRSGFLDLVSSVRFSVGPNDDGLVDANDFVGGTFPTSVVTFAPGQATQTISIAVATDSEFEPDEGFAVRLSEPSGDATVLDSTAVATIRNDDRRQIQSRIFIPEMVARPHVIPDDGIPTAILFQAVTDTLLTVTPIGSVSVTDAVLILDRDVMPITERRNGIYIAELVAGGLYAIVFPNQFSGGIYSVRSSAGVGALSNSPATNIFQPTDTDVDGRTTAVDALRVINSINSRDVSGEPIHSQDAFLDVNMDGRVSALDALTVINRLNQRDQTSTNPSGEPMTAVQAGPNETSASERSRQIISEWAAFPLPMPETQRAASPATVTPLLARLGSTAIDEALSEKDNTEEGWMPSLLDASIDLLAKRVSVA